MKKITLTQPLPFGTIDFPTTGKKKFESADIFDEIDCLPKDNTIIYILASRTMKPKPKILVIANGMLTDKDLRAFQMLPTCHREALARSFQNQRDKQIAELYKIDAPLEMVYSYGARLTFKDFEKLSKHKAKKPTTPNPRPLFGKDPNEVFNFKRKRG